MFLRYLLWLVLLWGFVSQQFLVAKSATFYKSQTSEYNSETQFDFEKVYADVQVINGFKVIPALALDYIQHKSENKKLTDLTFLAVDVASMGLGVGELAVAYSALSKSRKVFLALDLLNGAANIIVNTTSLQEDPTVQKFLFAYNLATAFQNIGSSYSKVKTIQKAEKVLQGAGKVLDDIVLSMKSNFPSTWKFNKISDDLYDVVDGTGKKWGTVTKDKITAPGRTSTGTPGNPIINNPVLVKNMKYDVDGFIYQTDDLGRVVKTNADLDDIARVRLGNQQIKAVDVKDGVRGTDQGGHIVGSRFFGPGEQINLYPQSANLNQGAWKTMENSWADAMVQGKDVKIEVEAIFSGTSKRPDSFKVKYTIDGQPFQENFINQ